MDRDLTLKAAGLLLKAVSWLRGDNVPTADELGQWFIDCAEIQAQGERLSLRHAVQLEKRREELAVEFEYSPQEQK